MSLPIEQNAKTLRARLVAYGLVLASSCIPGLALAAQEVAPAQKVEQAGAATLPAAVPIDLSSVFLQLTEAVAGEIVPFKSRNPEHFKQWFEGDLGPEVTLGAQLFVADGARELPLIVMVPGSAGVGMHHLDQAALLVEAGFAVLLIDPFKGRGISSTVANQGNLSWASGVHDIYAAIDAVTDHEAVNPAQIGLLGSSRGGFAVITAMMEQVSGRFAPGGVRILAGFAGYPWCGLQFWKAKLTPNSSLSIFSGDRDDWVSVQQCQDLIHALAQTESPVEIRILGGAFHAFDRSGLAPVKLPSVPSTITYPTVYMDDDGVFFDPRTGTVNGSLKASFFVRQAAEERFIRSGVTIGSRPGDAQAYTFTMLAFFRARLKRLGEKELP